MTHLDENDISAYIDGQLATERRLEVNRHIQSCAACRNDVGEVTRLLRNAPSIEAPEKRSRWLWRGVAISALAASLAGVTFLTRSSSVPGSVVRNEAAVGGEATTAIRVASPEEQSRTALRFVWHATEADFYRFALTTAEGKTIFRVETVDTVIFPPPGIMIETGQLYFWNVNAISNGVVATTNVQRLRVRP